MVVLGGRRSRRRGVGEGDAQGRANRRKDRLEGWYGFDGRRLCRHEGQLQLVKAKGGEVGVDDIVIRLKCPVRETREFRFAEAQREVEDSLMTVRHFSELQERLEVEARGWEKSGKMVT